MSSFTLFIVFIPVLAFILLAVNLIFAPHSPYQEKGSTFECGFHSFLGQNRTQFSISFFIFALLFLLFDLEILLVYPYVVTAYINDIYGLIIMQVFFLLLTLGFVFELGKNALSIDSKQLFLNNNKIKSEVSLMTLIIKIILSLIIAVVSYKLIIKIFNRKSFIKLIIIFFTGFITRALVNSAFYIDVFKEYKSLISIVYYMYWAGCLIYIHDIFIFIFININISMPSLSNYYDNFIFIFKYLNGLISNNLKIIFNDLKMDNFKL